MRGRAARLAGALGAVTLSLAGPAAVSAHQLSSVYASRLPLAVYVAGAAVVVALSFLFVLARDVRAAVTPDDGRRVRVPGWVRLLLRSVGLLAWLWIVVQGVLGGSSDAEVGHLFLWIYGWVGLAIVSALAGPAWEWLDPFATLHDMGAWALRRAGIRGIAPAPLPAWAAGWPAVAGFAVFIWLELVAGGGDAPVLFGVVVGYTVITLALMAQFGRDEWRRNGEVFGVWFGILGRLAPLALTDEPGRLRRRPTGAGLLEGGWRAADVVMVGLGTGSILFDGLSQTQVWYDIVGGPGTLGSTIQLVAFLGLIVAAAYLAVRAVGFGATGAGLLPIAVGYLIAHYLTYLLIDGQRIVVALADPFQQGWALLPTAFHEPTGDFLPPGLVWTVQLAAVVGGHMLGAWGGHVVAAREAAPSHATGAGVGGGARSQAGGPRMASGGKAGRAQASASGGQASGSARRAGAPIRDPRLREIPLAIVMVGLTTLTLWSLGQALVQVEP